MITLSKKTVSLVSKIGLLSLSAYIIGYSVYKTTDYYKTYYEKKELTKELQIKINETNNIKKKIEQNKIRIEKLQKSYLTKEEIDLKVKDIFNRMSVFDYNLKLLDSKKMCIDRYVLITQLTSQSEDGLKAGKGILSYIGEIKQSEQNETIYFVDYISQARDIK